MRFFPISPQVTIDAAEVTQDAEDGGTLVEPGEEVVQPVPAGARAGVAALPSAAAATQQQREQRREQQQQRQDRQDLQAAERRRLQGAGRLLGAAPGIAWVAGRARRPACAACPLGLVLPAPELMVSVHACAVTTPAGALQ